MSAVGILMGTGTWPPAASAKIVARTTSSAPCTLVVFDDETYRGCNEIVAGSEEGDLLSAAGDHAIAMLRAWRKRSAGSLFPPRDSKIDSTELAGRCWRDSMHVALAREMKRTVAIDSMVVRILADSASGDRRVIQSQYWIGRVVSGRDPPREIYRADYDEVWAREANVWFLSGMRLAGELFYPLRPAGNADSAFPIHPGRKKLGTDISVLAIRHGISSNAGAVITVSDILPTLAMGDEIGPFACAEQESQLAFVYYEEEPKPLATYRPDFPLAADGRLLSETVVLHVLVCKTGEVGRIKVAKGTAPFCAAAAVAVAQWTFSPATSNGKPVSVWIEVPVEFHR